jgi:hypothetical protein
MHATRIVIRIAVSLTMLASAFAAPASPGQLERGFAEPPDSARPWVYWFVMDGNLSREGITADFEALKRAGIRGVLFMEVDVGIPRGPVKFMSPEWRTLFTHANEEAARLGLVMTMPASPGWTGSGGPWVKPEQSMQKLVSSETNLVGPRRFEGQLPQPPAAFYRDVAVLAFPTPSAPYRIADIAEKAVYTRGHFSSEPGVRAWIPSSPTYPVLSAEQVIARNAIVDLSGALDARGRLAWDVPNGAWTVLRFGHTTTGATTRPAPEPGLGLECDKFDTAALESHFDNFLGKLLADIGPLAGKSLIALHIDSWEMGPQNWTAAFRDEFLKRRGYDLLLYLPVMTGRAVESLELSERFLWDLRQTVLELIADNHAARLAALARRHGLGLSIEPYDGTPCDDMTYGSRADVSMGEFWRDTFQTYFSCTEAASIAHTGGKRIVQAEAFTSGDGERWLAHPATLKALGDWAFCEGINRIVVHRYAHQPWLDRRPGMTMGPYGIHYERTQTWWEMSRAWIDYLSRCQFMLQQGLFVADVCFLEPEASPQVFRPPASATRGDPPDRLGYNFDGCTPEVLLTRMSVKDGRLVLPDGMSYRVLVLPEAETMTPALLRKIKELVEAGATIIGPPPLKSPSLSDWPRCDEEVRHCANELWGDCDGKTITEHAFGKGRVIWKGGSRGKVAEEPRNLLEKATWIWYAEGSPASSAAVGRRYFRRIVSLDEKAPIESARAVMTADNAFELFVNGRSAGRGDNFHRAYAMDVAALLTPGANVLAVEAENGADAPNPAGLIGALAITFRGGRAALVPTDRQWQSAREVNETWKTGAAGAAGWTAAMELGPAGMAPWGAIGESAPDPERFGDFAIVTGALARMGIAPDFETDPRVRFIHRRAGEIDIYFVANGTDRWTGFTGTFRVSGKAPELWDPMTGAIKKLAVYQEKDGRTLVPLRLEPAGSAFVVFRPSDAAAAEAPRFAPIAAVTREGTRVVPEPGRPLNDPPAIEIFRGRGNSVAALAWQSGRYELTTAAGAAVALEIGAIPAPREIDSAWHLRFEPGRGAPERIALDSLLDWSKHPEPGVRHYSGTATYTTTFNVPAEMIAEDLRVYLDLGAVEVMARVKLNGKDLGILWKAPFLVDATDAITAGDNALEITVANLWPNRLIGDQSLPPEKRVAWTTWNPFSKDSPLLPSGLLGPVMLRPARGMTVEG